MITIPVDRFDGLVGNALDGIRFRFAPPWTASSSSWTNSVRRGGPSDSMRAYLSTNGNHYSASAPDRITIYVADWCSVPVQSGRR